MKKSRFTGVSECYIFDEAGGMRDQLEQTILNELQAKKYPLKATISTVKASGGGIMGAIGASKEQCVVINVDKEAQIAISNTTIGTYLYVEVYLIIQEKIGIFSFLSSLVNAKMDNAFKQQRRNAYFVAAKETTEAAFDILNLKQANRGYKSSGRRVANNSK